MAFPALEPKRSAKGGRVVSKGFETSSAYDAHALLRILGVASALMLLVAFPALWGVSPAGPGSSSDAHKAGADLLNSVASGSSSGLGMGAVARGEVRTRMALSLSSGQTTLADALLPGSGSGKQANAGSDVGPTAQKKGGSGTKEEASKESTAGEGAGDKAKEQSAAEGEQGKEGEKKEVEEVKSSSGKAQKEGEQKEKESPKEKKEEKEKKKEKEEEKAKEKEAESKPATATEGAAAVAVTGAGGSPANDVPEEKMRWYMGVLAGLVGDLDSVLSAAQEKNNTQLQAHARVALERAREMREAWAAKGAQGGWGGEERVLGLIKLMEQIRARGQEWRNTLKQLEWYKEQAERMKGKMDEVARERNGLDLAVAKGLPKALFCFNLHLSQAFATNSKLRATLEEQQAADAAKLSNPELFHYALFSDNVLAAAVVVNSTVQNLEEPSRHVIHLVTDALNLPAMQAWFALHPPLKTSSSSSSSSSKDRLALEIRTVESFKFLNASYCPVLKQLQASNLKSYYFSAHEQQKAKRRAEAAAAAAAAAAGGKGQSDVGGSTSIKFKNPKYLSMLNHLRFYLPEMYPTLHRVVFLDDDIVVQRDLTPLFSVPLHGNVNAAVFTCANGSTFHRLQHYLNFTHPFVKAHFHPDACGWAYGMNVFDLDAWRAQELTKVYHDYQSRNEDRTLWKLGTLPPGLMTFYNRTEALDPSWHVLGLGYNREIPLEEATGAAVVHFNGNWKPWLDTALRHFKGFWTRYAAQEDEIIQQCNIDLS